MKQYRHRRSSNPSNAFPTLEPGELSVNTANRQLAAGDAAAGTVGVPLPLIAVRYFDVRGKYAIGDYVVNSGTLYKCTTAHGPAAFNPSNFTAVGTGGGGGGATLITSTTPPTPAVDNTLWWDSDAGLLYLRYNDGDSSQWVLASPIGGGGSGGGVSGDYLPLTGGVLSGNLGIIGASLIVQEDGGNADQGFTVYSYTGHTGVQLYDFSDDYYSEGISHALMAGTQAAPMPVQEQAEIGYTNWGGWDGTKVVFSAAMTGAVDGPVSDGVVPVALVLKSGSGAYGTERLRLKSNGTTLITGNLDVLGQVSVSGPLIAYPPAGSLPTGGPAVLFSKPRDPDNGRRYDFQDCGGLSSDYGGGFWRGMHFTAPPITDPVGGAALYPRIGIYAEYDTLTGPASRTWNLDMEGDSPTSKHTFHLRNNGADIFTANDAGVKSNAPLAAMNWFYSLANLPGIAPDFGGQTNGLGIGWNYSNGQGEVNLVSRYVGQTGFWFQNWNGSAMATWAKIDVNGLDVQNNIKLHGASPYMPQMQIYSSTPDATAGYLLLTKSRNGGVVQVNDGIGAIVWTAYTADGVSRNSPSITSNVLAVGPDWVSADLSINTIHTDGSYAPRINIRGDGVSISPPLLTENYARFGGNISIQPPAPGNSSLQLISGTCNIELGRVDGVASTPFIDFHSGASVVDFDARIVALNSGASATLRIDGANLELVKEPTVASHAATKRYVDNYAAPLDALAYNGLQMNGGMEVNQDQPTAATLSGLWPADRYQLVLTINGSMSALQVTDAPPGYSNSLKMTILTATPSLGATDTFRIAHNIEGYRISKLGFGTPAAQPITIAFWWKAHRTGVYSGSVRNDVSGTANRSYTFTWTCNVADTWEYKTVTIPGDTSGVWANTNILGLRLNFVVAAGASVVTAPGSWVAGSFFGATGAINGAAVASDTFQLTGVTVLSGIYAPTAAQAPNLLRPFDQELLACQRFFWCSNPLNPHGAAAGAMAGYSAIANVIMLNTWRFTVPMRVVPTIVPWLNGSGNAVRDSLGGTVYGVGAVNNTYFNNSGGSIMPVTSIAAGLWLDFDMTADARL